MAENQHLAGWQPPQNFTPVESMVEGITVYAPRSERPRSVSPASFKCPQCGATTGYDITKGGVACEYCGFMAKPVSHPVGKGAQEFEFTLETWSQATQGWGVARQELHCEHCGGNLIVTDGALTFTCPFCASNKVNLRAASADVLQPRFLIPFKILPETNRARAKEWLGRGWFHPKELAAAAVIDRFTGIYLPFWTFDALINAEWRAEVGYERQERYYDAGSKEWKTRTTIDWRWENGEVSILIDDLLIAGTGHLSRRILEKLYPFQLGDLVAYQPDYLAGWQTQAYEVTLLEAWEAGKARMREQAKQACHADIHSGHVRNFSMLADFDQETWRYILLPVYVAAYRFQNTVLQVMVNGQTGTIAGQKPVAWWKIWLAIGALLAPGLFLGLSGLPLLLAGGFGMVLIVVGFALLVLGGTLSAALYRQAVDSEAA